MKKRLVVAMVFASAFGFGCSGSGSLQFVKQTPVRPLTAFSTLEIAPFEAERGLATEDLTPEMLTQMRTEVHERIHKKNLFQHVALSTEDTENVLLMQITVTEFDSGSRIARYMVGFGAGKAKVTVNCKFVEKASNRLISETYIKGYLDMGLFGGSSEGAAEQVAKRLVSYIELHK